MFFYIVLLCLSAWAAEKPPFLVEIVTPAFPTMEYLACSDAFQAQHSYLYAKNAVSCDEEALSMDDMSASVLLQNEPTKFQSDGFNFSRYSDASLTSQLAKSSRMKTPKVLAAQFYFFAISPAQFNSSCKGHLQRMRHSYWKMLRKHYSLKHIRSFIQIDYINWLISEFPADNFELKYDKNSTMGT